MVCPLDVHWGLMMEPHQKIDDDKNDRFERVRAVAIYEIEKIIDHCRDQEGWRMRAIRESAQKIESAFID